MKILSYDEDESYRLEADDLIGIVEANQETLLSKTTATKTSIGGKSFHCVSSDKNIIYRVQGKHKWFLKFSLQEKWVIHEIAGAEAVNSALADFHGYQHPKSVRASAKGKYTLYSAINGKSFNRSLIETSLFGPTKLNRSTLIAAENLGRVLGRLHSYDGHPDLIAINPDNMFYIRSYLNKIRERSDIVERISDWISRPNMTPIITGWIHGNIKSEDIFINNDKVSIIDFGTCGTGIPYEDLTNLCTYMLLFRAVPLYPWKSARKVMNSLLRGYAEEFNYNKTTIAICIAQGVFRYYLKNIVIHQGFASLSRMPVMRYHVERLVLQLLAENYESAFEGLDRHVFR